MTFPIPAPLAANCRTPDRRAWLGRLPEAVDELARRWALEVDAPFDAGEGGCAWVAPARRADGTPAVLKLGMPHMEGAHEIAGLRFWAGDPMVRLIEADEALNAMLLERCEPGVPLRTLPETEQDVVIAGLLRRMWRAPSEPCSFRPLSDLTAYWAAETEAGRERWPDRGLVRAGLDLFEELPRTALSEAPLATDLHAGNVLRARRVPWLVIDPKPFRGDPAYDATQHLFNCIPRLCAQPDGVIDRFAELLGVERERVRLWTFARAAAEPRQEWKEGGRFRLARMIAP